MDDFSSAVASLQESCQLFDQRFGIGAEECGEAYLFYGTALLELARLEDGLFDGVVHTKCMNILIITTFNCLLVAELSGEEETEDEEEEEDESQEESQEESQDETENKDKGK